MPWSWTAGFADMKNPRYPKKRRPKPALQKAQSSAADGTVTMEGGTVMQFRSNLTMTCRCGKIVAFGYMGETATGMHAEPRCKEFEDMELLDYMRWLRSGIEEKTN